MFLIDKNHYFNRFVKPNNELIFSSLTNLVNEKQDFAQKNQWEFLIVDNDSNIILNNDKVFILITNDVKLNISGAFKTLVIEDISYSKEQSINIKNQFSSKIVYINNNQVNLSLEKTIIIDNYSSLNFFIYTEKNNTFIKNNLLINLFEKSEIDVGVFIDSAENQVYDLTTEIIHKEKNTKSSIEFIGVNEGKIVSQINSVVEKNILNCELKQHIKHILFSENALSYSKPSLMISAPCVASHGNSIGSIPDDWLFYLQSKGLTDKQSLNIIKTSLKNKFINDVSIPFLINGDFI